MGNKSLSFVPSYTIHPGEYLDEILEYRGMTQAELALRLGITRKHLSNIINCKVSITPDIATSLERVFNDYSSKYWLSLQTTYDLAQRKIEFNLQYFAAQDEHDEWLGQFNYHELVKLGYIKEINKEKTASAKIDNILNFFGCSTIDSWNNVYCSELPAACRLTGISDANRANAAAWIRFGQISVEREPALSCPYSKEKFKDALKEIRKLTLETTNGFDSEMIRLCEEAGVRLLFVKEVPKSAICGAAYWINETPCIQMSLRFKKNDHFWFTFFHEAFHILKEHRKHVYLDCDHVEKNEEENEANRLSGNFLIPEKEYKMFISKNSFYENDIVYFAKKIGIHPGIVVGRLQHDKKIDWSWHNNLKLSFRWED